MGASLGTPSSGRMCFCRPAPDRCVATCATLSDESKCLTLRNCSEYLEPEDNGPCLATLNLHSKCVRALVFASDGTLCTGGDDAIVKVWSGHPHATRCIANLRGHKDMIRALAYAPDGQLCSGSADRTVNVWDHNLLEERCVVILQHEGAVWDLVFTQSGMLCSACEDHSVRVWNSHLRNASCIATLRGHTGTVYALALARGGQLCSSSSDKVVKVWNADLRKEACIGTFTDENGGVMSLAFSPDNVLVSGGRDGGIRAWSFGPRNSGDIMTLLNTMLGHEGMVVALNFAPDGTLCSGSFDNTVRIWDRDLRTGSCIALFTGHKSGVQTLAFAQDLLLYSGGGEGAVIVWASDSIFHFRTLCEQVARDVCSRSLTLRRILDFFMRYVNSQTFDTTEVVLYAIKPYTEGHRCSLSEQLHQEAGGITPMHPPQHFVSHAWSGRHADLLRTLVLNASGWKTQELNLKQIEEELGPTSDGKSPEFLDEHFWLSCFCVNQHLSDNRVAKSSMSTLDFKDPRSEVTKFDTVIQRIHASGGDFIVALDAEFAFTKRLWCLCEVHEAVIKRMPLVFAQHPARGTLQSDDFLGVLAAKTTLEEDRAWLLSRVEGQGGTGAARADLEVQAAVTDAQLEFVARISGGASAG